MTMTVMAAAAAAAALAFPASASASVSTTCADVAHHENAAHDGRNCSTVPVNPAQLWSVTLNGSASYPVIAGGRVFVTTSNPGGSYGGSLYALDGQTGKILWGPIALSGTYFYFPLAYAGGRVFVNNFDGTVTAFKATTGAQEWSTTTSYFSSEPVVSQGEVWVQGAGSVYGLSAKTGAIEVQTGYLDGNGATPAVSKTGVYVSTGCQTQIKLSLAGQVAWEDNNGCSGGGGASTALWRGRMYGSEGDEILDQSTGAVEGSFSGVPAFSGSTGFFASGTTVSALNVVKGNAPVWSASLPADVVAGPVVTSSAVWVGTSASTLVALSPASGAVLSTITLPGTPGGGGKYSGDPSDIGIGNNILVVPTGSTVTAFG
jgi:outer membrane protein assembly factor BamB